MLENLFSVVFIGGCYRSQSGVGSDHLCWLCPVTHWGGAYCNNILCPDVSSVCACYFLSINKKDVTVRSCASKQLTRLPYAHYPGHFLVPE